MNILLPILISVSVSIVFSYFVMSFFNSKMNIALDEQRKKIFEEFKRTLPKNMDINFNQLKIDSNELIENIEETIEHKLINLVQLKEITIPEHLNKTDADRFIDALTLLPEAERKDILIHNMQTEKINRIYSIVEEIINNNCLEESSDDIVKILFAFTLSLSPEKINTNNLEELLENLDSELISKLKALVST
jgi:hypothetical protein